MRLVFLILSLFVSLSADAKRLAPQPVTPVTHSGLRFEAPHWAYENQKMKHNGGYVRVMNIQSGLPVCTKQVYETFYDTNIEEDIQDNFITSLKIEKDILLISSEKLPLVKKSLSNFCD